MTKTRSAGVAPLILLRHELLMAALLLIASGFINGCSPTPSRLAEGAVDLVIEDPSASHPTAAVDPVSDAVYLAYTSTQAGVADVFVRRLDPGADALGEPVRVNGVAGDAAVHAQAPAQVVTAPDGTVYVAWISQTSVGGRRFPASNIRVARSNDGGRTFEPAVTANHDAGFPTSHHFHNLATGPDGTVYVSWLDSEERDRAQRSRGDHAAPNEHDHEHEDPEDDGLPGTQLKVARSVDGGRTFEPAVVVAEGTCQCCRTALAAAADGAVYVAWRHIFGDQMRDMALSRSNDGGRTFSEPERVHADNWQINGCPHAGPAVAVDEQGLVHVVWYTGARGGAGVFHASSQDGGMTFGPAAALAGGVPISQVGAAAAARGDGALLAWENPRKDSVYVAFASGSVLERAEGMPGNAPALASSSRTEVVAWRENARTHLRVIRGFRRAG